MSVTARMFITVIALVVGLASQSPFSALAQETPSADTATALATATPVASATAPAASPTPSPRPVEPGALRLRFIERAGTSERVPAQIQMYLAPAGEPQRSVELRTAADATAAILNLPADDYMLRIYWPGGFVDPPAADDLPLILRAYFRVQADGSIVVPADLPATWPDGTSEPFDPAQDRTVLGRLPELIVLGEKHPDVLSFAPSSGGVLLTAVGVLDAGAVYGTAPSRPPVIAPNPGTGGASNGGTYAWLLMLPAAAALTLLAWGAARRQRN